MRSCRSRPASRADDVRAPQQPASDRAGRRARGAAQPEVGGPDPSSDGPRGRGVSVPGAGGLARTAGSRRCDQNQDEGSKKTVLVVGESALEPRLPMPPGQGSEGSGRPGGVASGSGGAWMRGSVLSPIADGSSRPTSSSASLISASPPIALRLARETGPPSTRTSIAAFALRPRSPSRKGPSTREDAAERSR